MGRGRAKAKQTKVARSLKYRTFDTDFSSLERELRGDRDDGQVPNSYPSYADQYEEDAGEDPESVDLDEEYPFDSRSDS